MAKVLGVGIATLDIINAVDGYPVEDSELRATTQSISRGGNVTNTMVVLSQLGHDCYWFGTRADDPGSEYILAELDEYGIDYSLSQLIPASKTPTSYITLNRANGSRTIVHYRDLPEAEFEHFQQHDLNTYDWLHFEGRNVAEVMKMVVFAKQQQPDLAISLEVEKPREGIDQLFPVVDYLLFSKAYALHSGFSQPDEFLCHMHTTHPDQQLVCAWGEDGAYVMTGKGVIHVLASPQDKVVDTLAAGDTFNAGFIHGQLQKKTLVESLEFACQLAGKKCAQHGLSDLA